jgi:hypothetical protein
LVSSFYTLSTPFSRAHLLVSSQIGP